MAELTRTRIDAEHFVARYAQGRLGEAELEAFEEFCVLHPDIVEQVQTDRVLIKGLRHPQATRRPRPARWQVFALAASVFIAVFGLAFWQWQGTATAEDAYVYRATDSLPTPLAQRMASAPVISIIRSRAATRISVEPDSKALKLEFEPARTAGAREYRVALAEEIDGVWVPRPELEHVVPEDRSIPAVIVIVDLTKLASTHLRITLGTAGGQTDEFFLHIGDEPGAL